jgi:hypothetical protein
MTWFTVTFRDVSVPVSAAILGRFRSIGFWPTRAWNAFGTRRRRASIRTGTRRRASIRTRARKENTTSRNKRTWNKWGTKYRMVIRVVMSSIFDRLLLSSFSCNKKCHEKENQNQPRFSSGSTSALIHADGNGNGNLSIIYLRFRWRRIVSIYSAGGENEGTLLILGLATKLNGLCMGRFLVSIVVR